MYSTGFYIKIYKAMAIMSLHRKCAVRFIIHESTPADRLSLVTFHSFASRPLRLRKMDREGQDEATVATLRMSAGGATCITSGLDLALQVLEQRWDEDHVGDIPRSRHRRHLEAL